jgi:hypothetical protein
VLVRFEMKNIFFYFEKSSRLKNYNAKSSLFRFDMENIFFYFEKGSSLLQRWRYTHYVVAGLPDGIFTNQKSKFVKILEGLRIGNFGIFYGDLEYFTAVRCILWPGNVVEIRYVFPHFGIFSQEKSGNPV